MLAIECLVFGGRNMVTLHESLGKILTAFEYGTLFRRTDNGDMTGALITAELIVDTFHQWVLRTNNHHVNQVVHDKVFQFVELIHADRHVLSNRGGSSVSRSNEQFLTFLALSNLPGQCVLTTTTA